VPTSLAFDTSIREASRQHIAMTFGVEKVEWFGYLMVKKFLKIQLLVLTEFTSVRDGQTDTT